MQTQTFTAEPNLRPEICLHLKQEVTVKLTNHLFLLISPFLVLFTHSFLWAQCPDLKPGIYVCIDQENRREPMNLAKAKNKGDDAIVLYEMDESPPAVGYPCINETKVNTVCAINERMDRARNKECLDNLGFSYTIKTAKTTSNADLFHNEMSTEIRELGSNRLEISDLLIMDIRRIHQEKFILKFFVDDRNQPRSTSTCTFAPVQIGP